MDDFIQPSRKITEPNQMVLYEHEANQICMQEKPILKKEGDDEAPEEEEDEEINQRPVEQAIEQPQVISQAKSKPKRVIKRRAPKKKFTKILKPIVEDAEAGEDCEEETTGSVNSSHYKHVFKRCHQDLKQMIIGPHVKSEFMRSPQLLNELLEEIIEIKANL